MAKIPKAKEGAIFGYWRVIARIDRNYALCRCSCGNEVAVYRSNLTSGKSKGCIKCRKNKVGKGRLKHGMTNTREYRIWAGMLTRCTNPNNNHYTNYGGRGIGVCTRWRSFINFFEDMGYAPSHKHSLDRIDVNKGYSKSNCRWATAREQSANKRKPCISDAFIETILYQNVRPQLIAALYSVQQQSVEKAIGAYVWRSYQK